MDGGKEQKVAKNFVSKPIYLRQKH